MTPTQPRFISRHSISTAGLAPLLATAIARELKASGYTIWLIQKLDYGLVMRCELAARQLRVILPPLVDGDDATVPSEKGAFTFVVRNMDDFRHWLRSLTPTPAN